MQTGGRGGRRAADAGPGPGWTRRTVTGRGCGRPVTAARGSACTPACCRSRPTTTSPNTTRRRYRRIVCSGACAGRARSGSYSTGSAARRCRAARPRRAPPRPPLPRTRCHCYCHCRARTHCHCSFFAWAWRRVVLGAGRVQVEMIGATLRALHVIGRLVPPLLSFDRV